jgi:DNA-binding response OmpR family regulator
MKVLIADDDRVLSHLLAGRLRALGWNVDLAGDAMQAVMFAIRNSPDVIVLDIQMPGGTGVDALRKLKASAKTCQVPVVVLTGSVDPDDEPSFLAQGAAAFVRKPADVDALHETLLRQLGAARS